MIESMMGLLLEPEALNNDVPGRMYPHGTTLMLKRCIDIYIYINIIHCINSK